MKVSRKRSLQFLALAVVGCLAQASLFISTAHAGHKERVERRQNRQENRQERREMWQDNRQERREMRKENRQERRAGRQEHKE